MNDTTNTEIRRRRERRSASALVRQFTAHVVGMVLMAAVPAFAADWTIGGTVRVANQIADLTPGTGDTVALGGALLRVRSSYVGGTAWRTWLETQLAADGSFSVSKSKNSWTRRIQIQVKFESDWLHIKRPRSDLSTVVRSLVSDVLWGDLGALWSTAFNDDWYTIYDSSRGPGELDGTFVFDGGARLDLSDDTAREHAELWYMLTELRHELSELGVPMREQTRVGYPAHDIVETWGLTGAFADPKYTDNTMVLRDEDFDAYTPVHEAMHLWAYQHSSGEEVLWTELRSNMETHCFVDNPGAALHEGFAHYAAEQMLRRIWGVDETACEAQGCLPYNRAWLSNGMDGSVTDGAMSCPDADRTLEPVETLDDAVHHEAGWVTFFRMLTLPDVNNWEFLQAGDPWNDPYVQPRTSDCATYSYTFEDVLEAINGGLVEFSSPGVIEADLLNGYDVSFEGFLERMEFSGESDVSSEEYLALLDPAESFEAWEVERDCVADLVVNFYGASVRATGTVLEVSHGEPVREVDLQVSYTLANVGRGPVDGDVTVDTYFDGRLIDTYEPSGSEIEVDLAPRGLVRRTVEASRLLTDAGLYEFEVVVTWEGGSREDTRVVRFGFYDGELPYPISEDELGLREGISDIRGRMGLTD